MRATGCDRANRAARVAMLSRKQTNGAPPLPAREGVRSDAIFETCDHAASRLRRKLVARSLELAGPFERVVGKRLSVWRMSGGQMPLKKSREPNQSRDRFGCSDSSKTRSVVIFGSDLPLDPGGVVVLNPQLRLVLFHECFDHLSALRGLLLIRVEGGNFLVRDLFRIVIEIAR
jgi:hypothetical protein